VPSMPSVLVGFLVALTIGLTGVGGGTLTVPILVLFLGVPTGEAVGTALVFSALVKIPACGVYLRQRSVDFPVLRRLLLGGGPGVVLGSLAVSGLEGAGLKDVVAVVVGAVITATAALGLARLAVSTSARRESANRSRWLPWITLPIGMEVGFSSAGAGALGTLVLFSLTSLTTAQVVGTDLMFGLALSTLGGGLHVALGHWSRLLLAGLVMGGVPGALLGAWLGTVLPGRTLRMALLVWLIYLGSQLFYRGVLALAG
jgi:uncharacterized membrane protein YfcA